MGKILDKVYLTQFFLSLAAGLFFGGLYNVAIAVTAPAPLMPSHQAVLAAETMVSGSPAETLAPVHLATTPVLTPPPDTPAVLAEAITPKLVLSPSPTTTPTPTPSPSPTDTRSQVVATIIATQVTDTPTPTPTPTTDTTTTSGSVPANPGGLDPNVLFQMVQNHRTSMGLPPFQQDGPMCALAASRAPEVNGEVASGNMHAGLKARNLPYWESENIISMNSEQAAFTWWLNDYIHRKAIEGDYKYSCLACSGNACAEEFTNYQPK